MLFYIIYYKCIMHASEIYVLFFRKAIMEMKRGKMKKWTLMNHQRKRGRRNQLMMPKKTIQKSWMIQNSCRYECILYKNSRISLAALLKFLPKLMCLNSIILLLECTWESSWCWPTVRCNETSYGSTYWICEKRWAKRWKEKWR